tara:strand:- start:310 stop:654 length:345 start_codon:yes stop_codon:yes gene_type:complete
MAKVVLKDIAFSRSGDKGDNANVGLIFINKKIYTWAEKNLTSEVIKEYMGDIVLGDIIRYELPNINALNFILKNCLGGGGSISMLNDAQGKTLGQAVIMLEVDIPDNLFESIND